MWGLGFSLYNKKQASKKAKNEEEAGREEEKEKNEGEEERKRKNFASLNLLLSYLLALGQFHMKESISVFGENMSGSLLINLYTHLVRAEF